MLQLRNIPDRIHYVVFKLLRSYAHRLLQSNALGMHVSLHWLASNSTPRTFKLSELLLIALGHLNADLHDLVWKDLVPHDGLICNGAISRERSLPQDSSPKSGKA